MLDVSFIKDNKEFIQKNCDDRRVKIDIDSFLRLHDERLGLQQEIESLRAERNKKSKGKPSDEEIEALRKIGEKIATLEEKLGEGESTYREMLMAIPNMTHPKTPRGGEEDFTVLETHGTEPVWNFEAKDHETIMERLDMIDFERAAKVTGAKFYFLKNDAVRLNQALLAYGMDIAEQHGFTLMETPDLAKHEVIEGLGFTPRGKETQIYSIEGEDLSLIGTAEITLGGFHKDEVVDLSNGPKKYVALSHCFRTEAGSYGRTSKGLYRVHQFTKLEMFVLCKPEESEALHAEILEIEKEICDGLEIPYRVIDVASADLGGPAYRKFDVEAWMVMNNGYGEITSCSNCTDFQARRLNIKYKNDDGKNVFVHTLNGTAIVSSRFPIAIIENHQQKDGSIAIPKKLASYFGKEKIS